jgi:hypothetical protein
MSVKLSHYADSLNAITLSRYAEHHCAEFVMLRAIFLSVIMLSVIMLGVIMRNVIMIYDMSVC